jgi:DNA-binding transcriptional ArsR family regulator
MTQLADKPRAERKPIPDEAVELIASYIKVIAEPFRIRLLDVLRKEPGTVQELSDQLPGSSHQNVSKHLCVLFQAGMVSRRREGAKVVYTLIDWSGWWVVEQIAQAVTTRIDELAARVNGSA